MRATGQFDDVPAAWARIPLGRKNRILEVPDRDQVGCVRARLGVARRRAVGYRRPGAQHSRAQGDGRYKTHHHQTISLNAPCGRRAGAGGGCAGRRAARPRAGHLRPARVAQPAAAWALIAEPVDPLVDAERRLPVALRGGHRQVGLTTGSIGYDNDAAGSSVARTWQITRTCSPACAYVLTRAILAVPLRSPQAWSEAPMDGTAPGPTCARSVTARPAAPSTGANRRRGS